MPDGDRAVIFHARPHPGCAAGAAGHVKELRGSAAGRLDPGMPGHPAGQAPKLHNTVIKDLDRAIVQKISLPAPRDFWFHFFIPFFLFLERTGRYSELKTGLLFWSARASHPLIRFLFSAFFVLYGPRLPRTKGIL